MTVGAEILTPDGHTQFGAPFKNFVHVAKGTLSSAGTVSIMGQAIAKTSVTVTGYAPIIAVTGSPVVGWSVSFSGSSWTFEFLGGSGGTYHVFDQMPVESLGYGIDIFDTDHTTLLFSIARKPIRPKGRLESYDELPASLGVYQGSPVVTNYESGKTYAVIPTQWATGNTETSDLDGYMEYLMTYFAGGVGGVTASSEIIRSRTASGFIDASPIAGACTVVDVTNY